MGLTIFAVYPASFRLIEPVFSDVNATKTFQITASIEKSNQTIDFVLENNDELVSQDLLTRYPGIHGQDSSEETVPSTQVQFTRGTVWMHDTYSGTQKNVGWARLAVIQDGINLLFDGAFTVRDSQYAVEIETHENGSTAIVAHEHEPAFTTNSGSSHSTLCATAPETHLHKRQASGNWGDENWTSTIGNNNGCPTTREIANIGIMTDCTYTAGFNSSDSARRYILNMVNTASVVFENSFNISLAVRNLTVSPAECPSTTSDTTAWNVPCSQGDLNTRLQEFSTWRSSVYDENAYWTLLTGCSVSFGEIGVSWIGTLCNAGSGYSSRGASANVVARTQDQWQVFA